MITIYLVFLLRFLKCRPVKRNGDACKLLDGLAGKGAPTRRTARRITVQVNDVSLVSLSIFTAVLKKNYKKHTAGIMRLL